MTMHQKVESLTKSEKSLKWPFYDMGPCYYS
jgi:hypothetical protein